MHIEVIDSLEGIEKRKDIFGYSNDRQFKFFIGHIIFRGTSDINFEGQFFNNLGKLKLLRNKNIGLVYLIADSVRIFKLDNKYTIENKIVGESISVSQVEFNEMISKLENIIQTF